MSRRDDRIHAFSLIFASQFGAEDDRQAAFDNYTANHLEDGDDKADKPDLEYVKKTYSGTLDNLDEIDALIARFSEGWQISRMSKVDLCVLRLAVYELMSGLPHKVAVNEALEISAQYSGDQAKPFVNGILGRVIAHLRIE